jgi:hypothetical protein
MLGRIRQTKVIMSVSMKFLLFGLETLMAPTTKFSFFNLCVIICPLNLLNNHVWKILTSKNRKRKFFLYKHYLGGYVCMRNFAFMVVLSWEMNVFLL